MLSEFVSNSFQVGSWDVNSELLVQRLKHMPQTLASNTCLVQSIAVNLKRFCVRCELSAVRAQTQTLITKKMAMTKGRKTLTKLNTHVGSKLFRLAMLPVPKKDINSR